ncbi:MAG: GxxExxY protein [Candidatus Promineifilaceae bacterium]
MSSKIGCANWLEALILLYDAISAEIIGSFYQVYRTLGRGLEEKAYENSLAVALRKQGLTVEQQAPVNFYYEGAVVGDYVADLVVENRVILELETAEKISEAKRIQLLNYLKASQLLVGYILNFGPTPTFERRVAGERVRK